VIAWGGRDAGMKPVGAAAGSGPRRLGCSESGDVIRGRAWEGSRDPFTRSDVKLYTACGPGLDRQESGLWPGLVTTV
jgi:hypothetical protein